MDVAKTVTLYDILEDRHAGLPVKLTDAEVEALVTLLGYHAKAPTKRRLKGRLIGLFFANHPSYRRVVVRPKVQYIVGQDHAPEIATVRNRILSS